MARYDTLTGLANRVVFVEALQHAIAGARRSAKILAVLYLDLDHFKDINDTLGHQRWPGESGQGDKWIFCLRAARIAADQERA
jgi:diguanylate cyclase (GGDEF)-like protein